MPFELTYFASRLRTVAEIYRVIDLDTPVAFPIRSVPTTYRVNIFTTYTHIWEMVDSENPGSIRQGDLRITQKESWTFDDNYLNFLADQDLLERDVIPGERTQFPAYQSLLDRDAIPLEQMPNEPRPRGLPLDPYLPPIPPEAAGENPISPRGFYDPIPQRDSGPRVSRFRHLFNPTPSSPNAVNSATSQPGPAMQQAPATQQIPAIKKSPSAVLPKASFDGIPDQTPARCCANGPSSIGSTHGSSHNDCCPQRNGSEVFRKQRIFSPIFSPAINRSAGESSKTNTRVDSKDSPLTRDPPSRSNPLLICP